MFASNVSTFTVWKFVGKDFSSLYIPNDRGLCNLYHYMLIFTTDLSSTDFVNFKDLPDHHFACTIITFWGINFQGNSKITKFKTSYLHSTGHIMMWAGINSSSNIIHWSVLIFYLTIQVKISFELYKPKTNHYVVLQWSYPSQVGGHLDSAISNQHLLQLLLQPPSLLIPAGNV